MVSAIRHSLPTHSTHLPISPLQTDDRGWTNFERAEGQLIKPDSFCVDIGLFSEKAAENRQAKRIGEVPFAKKSVRELAYQGSYHHSGERGLLGSLVSSKRDAPLSPDAFATVLSKKEFTNGADSGTVINLYRNTATALLGSTRELRYHRLEWSEAQFERLGEALCYCGALETLEVKGMQLSDTAAAAVVAGLASCTSLQTLNLSGCSSLTALLGLSGLTSLQTLNLRDCNSLTALPDLSALTSLETLDLGGCKSLTALPDLSALTSLKTLDLGGCKSLTALPDLSALTSLKTLDLGGCKSLTALPDLSALTSLKTLDLGGCKSLTALPDLSALTSLETLDLRGCKSLTALPDLSALTSLKTLDLEDCRSLTALPDLSARKGLKVYLPDHQPSDLFLNLRDPEDEGYEERARLYEVMRAKLDSPKRNCRSACGCLIC